MNNIVLYGEIMEERGKLKYIYVKKKNI